MALTLRCRTDCKYCIFKQKRLVGGYQWLKVFNRSDAILSKTFYRLFQSPRFSRAARRRSLLRKALFQPIESLEPRRLLSESATAQLSLVSTTGTQANPVYHYSITVNDTGTTNIGTFWFAWVPGADFLPTSPSAVSNPTGWTNTLTGTNNSTDGTAIEWVASSNAITPGHSLGGFDFTTTDSPTVLAGNAPTHPANKVLTSFIYSGAPFSDAGVQFDVAPAATTAASTTTLNTSASSADAGTSITLTATVASSSGTGATPTGSVSFTRDGNALGSANLVNGTATFTTSALPVGTDHITASYGGDANYSSSASAPLTETISPPANAAATTTAVTSSAPSAAANTSVTLTATVTPSAQGPAPTGTVSFTLNGNVLGTSPVGSDGTATFTTSSLETGSDPIIASYSGDSVYAASTSQPFTQTITAPQTTVPTIVKSTLPKSIVAGAAMHGVVTIHVSNGTGAAIKGKMTIAIFASADGQNSSVLLAQVSKTLNILTTKAAVASVPIHLVASQLPAGDYTIFARVTDPSGNVNDSAAGPTLTAAAPFIALSETVAKSTLPASATGGSKTHGGVSLVITNNGNISTTGNTTITIFATTSGSVDSSSVQLATAPLKSHIKPSKTGHANVKLKQFPAIPVGSYTVVAQVTDQNGQNTFVTVGPLTITG